MQYLHDAAQNLAIAKHVQLDLHRVDRGDLQRPLDLTAAHVAEPDPLDRARAFQAGKRAYAGPERRARIGRVQLIERDAFDAERAPAGMTRRRQMRGPAIGDPLSARTRQPALRGDDDARTVAGPGLERTGDDPLVVPHIGLIKAVGVRRVEEGGAGVERGMQHGNGAVLVAIGHRRQAHTAHPD